MAAFDMTLNCAIAIDGEAPTPELPKLELCLDWPWRFLIWSACVADVKWKPCRGCSLYRHGFRLFGRPITQSAAGKLP
jgi:hypothetical protein